MKTTMTVSNAANPDKDWQKTQFSNLIRYVPSGTYFARIRVRGKLIRKSLKTDVLTTAKLRLADMEKNEREAAESNEAVFRGRMTFGDCVALFKAQTEASKLLKLSAKSYRNEVIDSIIKSWPDVASRDVRRFNPTELNTWAAKFSGEYSATRYNGAVGIMRQIFKVAIQAGALFRNPAQEIHRAKVRPKMLKLPSAKQFEHFLKEIESANGRDSRKCADLVRFLAFGGFRISEARNITWTDCNFEKNEILVRGIDETGTKNWGIRRIPMIPEMKQLLGRLKEKRPNEPLTKPVMQVKECLQAMTRAAKAIEMERITHHDLRHLFATRCIEAGVDIPTVSRWLGHKDGGALAMRVYGHLRDCHSAEMAQKVRFLENQPLAA